MDNHPKKSARKAHDINTHLEEENLWDLDDEWEDSDAPQREPIVEPMPEPSHEEVSDRQATDAADQTPPQPEPSDDGGEEQEAQASEPSLEPSLKAGIKRRPGNTTPFDHNKFDLGDLEAESEIDSDASQDNGEPALGQASAKIDETPSIESDQSIPPAAISDDPPQPEPEEQALAEEPNPGEPATRPSSQPLAVLPRNTSVIEKLALSCLALLFIGMTIWGIIWLKQKNRDAAPTSKLELPAKGKHATISGFESYWTNPGDTPGIKLGAVVIPAVNITLDDSSSSGSLRVYFRNDQNDLVGDTITITFQDGVFSNGSKSIEVSGSDGFHLKGDFHAYQMDENMTWEVEILEAAQASSSQSDFKTLIRTRLSPVMR